MQTTDTIAKSLLKPRDPESHKGAFGYALLACGSYGMAGAAVLCARACLHAGAGLVSVCSPECNREIIQAAVPEAMYVKDIPSEAGRITALACGCGMGKSAEAGERLRACLQLNLPMVIDADAINMFAARPELFTLLHSPAIFTPHEGEFDRLCGPSATRAERCEKAAAFAIYNNVYVVLKGHRTRCFTPDGKDFENTRGNDGMATAGSGDVLTGIIASLLAQGYTSEHAAVFGVYLHSLAGDLAAEKFSREYMCASEIVACLADAFGELRSRV